MKVWLRVGKFGRILWLINLSTSMTPHLKKMLSLCLGVEVEHKIYNEDCREFLDRDIPYDYVLTSPPDFMEIGLTAKKGLSEYQDFLTSVYEKLSPD